MSGEMLTRAFWTFLSESLGCLLVLELLHFQAKPLSHRSSSSWLSNFSMITFDE